MEHISSGWYSVEPYHTHSARYFIRVDGSEVFWRGTSDPTSARPAWSNLGHGTFCPGVNQFGVKWVDDSSSNRGLVILQVEGNQLRVVGGNGFDIGSVFKRT
eukprot:TRINITY_DN7463_c0_g1_i1.p1 TRINITY_DN7463_c0_g1~~TRINITY_DN7463_c0_g1_i1.p1  ORF type:complete len:102 (-),score=15.02 TRINITY_DN7463_c0_g1_i1:43-348(-)